MIIKRKFQLFRIIIPAPFEKRPVEAGRNTSSQESLAVERQEDAAGNSGTRKSENGVELVTREATNHHLSDEVDENKVYSRHATANRSAETGEASLSREQSGTTPSTGMNAPTQTSYNKDKGLSDTEQERKERKKESEEAVQDAQPLSAEDVATATGQSDVKAIKAEQEQSKDKSKFADEDGADTEKSIMEVEDGKPSRLGVITIVPDNILDPAGQMAVFDYSDEINEQTNSGWEKWDELTEAYNRQAQESEKTFTRGDTATLGFKTVDAAVKFREWISSIQKQQITESLLNNTQAQQLATDAVLTALNKTGIDVVMVTGEQVDAMLSSISEREQKQVVNQDRRSSLPSLDGTFVGDGDVQFMRRGGKKESAPETASPANQDHHTVVSSADGAKILTYIEKGKLMDEIAQFYSSPTELSSTADLGASNQNRPTDGGKVTSAPTFIGNDKRLLSILQTNSSKVVDENGEPREIDGIFVRSDRNFMEIINDALGYANRIKKAENDTGTKFGTMEFLYTKEGEDVSDSLMREEY